MSGLIVDAQIHVWSTVAAGGRPHLTEPFSAAAAIALMDDAGVDRAVLVPPSWSEDGNRVALDAVREYPGRFAVMGLLAMADPASRSLLRSWRSIPGMLGVRQSLGSAERARTLLDGHMDWFWPEAQEHGIPVMLYPPRLLSHLPAIARSFPRLRIVIDHMAMPQQTDISDREETLTALLRLSSFENVAVKVSSLPLLATDGYPFREARRYCRAVIDEFGAQRAFWGTDLTRLPCTYREAVGMMDAALIDLEQGERDLVMGEGIMRWLGWG
jgi:L-fuconolactonase